MTHEGLRHGVIRLILDFNDVVAVARVGRRPYIKFGFRQRLIEVVRDLEVSQLPEAAWVRGLGR